MMTHSPKAPMAYSRSPMSVRYHQFV